MDLTLRETTGSDLTLDRESLTIVRKFQVIGTLPYQHTGDAFDYVASQVMSLIRSSYPTYGTDMGTLYWNSIQLSEEFYAQKYNISVIYSPFNKASGAYQITVDQAVGNVHVTAGRRIAGYDGTGKCPDNGGVFFDGTEITGTEIMVAEGRFSVSYRHPQAWLNGSYIRAVEQLVGFPCADTFLGYAAGECQYAGGNFTETDAEASASYSFVTSRNVTNLVVGGVTITSKAGFDVLSPTYEMKDWAAGDGTKHPTKVVKGIEVIRRENGKTIDRFSDGIRLINDNQ